MFERFEKRPDEPTVAGLDPAVAATQAGPLTAQDMLDYQEWAVADDFA